MAAIHPLGNDDEQHQPIDAGPALSVVHQHGSTVVALRGEQDLSVVGDIRDALALAISGGDGDLIVDLTDVPFVDVTVVRALTEGRELLQSRSRAMFVRGPSRTVGRALALCGLADAAEPVSHPPPTTPLPPAPQAP
jgi:anti-sigma B factor antagonist